MMDGESSKTTSDALVRRKSESESLPMDEITHIQEDKIHNDDTALLLLHRIRVLEKELAELRAQSTKKVADFYSGSTIFMTGATGYIGTLVLEKLLRTCPKIKRIYLLVREKRGKTSDERFDELLSCPAFEMLRKSLDSAFLDFVKSKTQVLHGDILDKQLGLSDDVVDSFSGDLDFIIHSAASLSFSNPLPKAVNENYLSTSEIVRLAKKCKALRGMVHISTAYANVNCHENTVLEKVYPSGIDREKLLQRINDITPEAAEAYANRLMKKFHFPNSYTLTKHLAEEMLENESLEFPLAIIRPSIVSGVLRDPVPGWIGNRSGLSGVILGIGAGLIDFLPALGDMSLDIIPGDMVANAIICSLPFMPPQSGQMRVFHVCSSSLKQSDASPDINEILSPVVAYLSENPLPIKKEPGLNFRIYRPNIFVHLRMKWTEFKLSFFSWTFKLLGRRELVKQIDRAQPIVKELNALEYFTTHTKVFSVKNTIQLHKQLLPEDSQRYPMLPYNMDWNEYITLICRGVADHLIPKRIRKNTIVQAGKNTIGWLLMKLFGWTGAMVLLSFVMWYVWKKWKFFGIV